MGLPVGFVAKFMPCVRWGKNGAKFAKSKCSERLPDLIHVALHDGWTASNAAAAKLRGVKHTRTRAQPKGLACWRGLALGAP